MSTTNPSRVPTVRTRKNTTKAQRHSLPHSLAYASVARHMAAEGLIREREIPHYLHNENFKTGRGTPAGLDGVRSPLAPKPPTSTHERAIPLDTSAIEALDDFTSQLDLAYRISVNHLATALLEHIHDHTLLQGWSSSVVAVAAMVFAYHALLPIHHDVSENFAWLEVFGIHPDLARTGYNALWSYRKQLQPLTEAHGGSIKYLSRPIDQRGRQSKVVLEEWLGMSWAPNKVELLRDLGLELPEAEKRPLRRMESVERMEGRKIKRKSVRKSAKTGEANKVVEEAVESLRKLSLGEESAGSNKQAEAAEMDDFKFVVPYL